MKYLAILTLIAAFGYTVSVAGFTNTQAEAATCECVGCNCPDCDSGTCSCADDCKCSICACSKS